MSALIDRDFDIKNPYSVWFLTCVGWTLSIHFYTRSCALTSACLLDIGLLFHSWHSTFFFYMGVIFTSVPMVSTSLCSLPSSGWVWSRGCDWSTGSQPLVHWCLIKYPLMFNINLAPTDLLSFIDILVQTRDGLAATAVSCRVHVCIIPGVCVLLIILT